MAGQIARIKGCRVIGIAGGPEKCAWLTGEARFDGAIDYKNEDVDARIGELCRNRVDVFFDNVGGGILEAALNHINMRARVVLCGGISSYNATAPVPGPANLMNLVVMRARMEGFIVIDYFDRMATAAQELMAWIQSGELIYQNDIQEGFENIPQTLTRLFTGQNRGQAAIEDRRPCMSLARARRSGAAPVRAAPGQADRRASAARTGSSRSGTAGLAAAIRGYVSATNRRVQVASLNRARTVCDRAGQAPSSSSRRSASQASDALNHA